MDLTLTPRQLHGSIAAIPSKSQAHRLLLCAAFADGPTFLHCPDTNRDIEATADCLRALGSDIRRTAEGYAVVPIGETPGTARLCCGESGSTLRFLLPVAAALGVDAIFRMEGRLPQRPLSPLWEELEAHGCALEWIGEGSLRCCGQLQPGSYRIRGDVSSQFITGLLYALSLLPEESRLEITGKAESRPYIDMTLQALSAFGAEIAPQGASCRIRPARLHTPGTLTVEGDWSNAAFWLAAKALGSSIEVTGLAPDSPQGDRLVIRLLEQLERFAQIDAAQTPDLVPVLAVAAGAKQGALFTNAARLRLKETDRLQTTAAMINCLGGRALVEGDTLRVFPTGYAGGTVDAANDHRIAMAAAIAATVSKGAVTVLGAQCVEKSYPGFWRDYELLGGAL